MLLLQHIIWKMCWSYLVLMILIEHATGDGVLFVHPSMCQSSFGVVCSPGEASIEMLASLSCGKNRNKCRVYYSLFMFDMDDTSLFCSRFLVM